MCGEIPKDCSAYTITVTLTQNETRKLVRLNKLYENIVEVRLDEYAIRAPNGSSVNPARWLMTFGSQLGTDHVNDGTRDGYPIVIDNATLTHVVFQRPRVIAKQTHPALSQFEMQLSNPINGATPVTFEEAIFYFTIVVRDKQVNYEAQKANLLLRPPLGNTENDWRNSEFQTEVSSLIDMIRGAKEYFSAPIERKCTNCSKR